MDLEKRQSEIVNPKSHTRVAIFKLADHEHAVDVRIVKKILKEPEISSVIEAPDFVEGVINMRDKAVPIVNMRKRLNLPQNDKMDASCVIVVEYRDHYVGILVDSVSELLTIPNDKIEEPTRLVTGIQVSFIKGVVYLEDRFLVLLDLEAVFSLNGGESLKEQIENVPKTPEGLIHISDVQKIAAFELDDELYGACIEDVVEIMKMPPVMPLPNVEKFILGLINIRGDVLPVIDLKELFQLNKKIFDGETRIIVMHVEDFTVGLVVDRVWELLRLSPDDFQPPPPDVARIDESYFKAVAAVDDRMLIVLDVNKIIRETANK